MSILDPYSEAVIGAAVEASLKPLIKAVDLAVTPPAEAVGHAAATWVRNRLAKLHEGAAHRIGATGISPHQPLSPKVALRIAEGYIPEDDAFLEDCWEGLLASEAVKPGAVLPSFTEILRNLSGDDARFLDALYRTSFDSPQQQRDFAPRNFYSTEGRNIFSVDVMGRSVDGPDDDELFERLGTAFQNLMRLRLITDETQRGMSLTLLGYRLVRACRGPKKG